MWGTDGTVVVSVVPSPKLHSYLTMAGAPGCGVAVMTTGWFKRPEGAVTVTPNGTAGKTSTGKDIVPFCPLASVAVTVTVKVPAVR